jgi:hypothetical protein
VGQQVTGNLQIQVQGTGSDKAGAWTTRNVTISNTSDTLTFSQTRRTTSVAASVIFTPPLATATFMHLKASSAFVAILNGKTMIASHLFVEKAGITSLVIKKKTGGTNVMVDILIVGH